MADVVEIARSRRARLAAEIARLDDFIRMAEMLLRYADGPGGGFGEPAADGAPEPLPATEPEARAGAAQGKVAGGAAGGDAEMPASRVNGAAPKSAAESAAGDEAKGEATGEATGNADRIDVLSKTSPEEDELVLREGLSQAGDGTDARLDGNVGQRLRQRRWMIGLTKKQLADRLGISVEEVQDYEQGSRHIGTGRMWHLAAALEVPMTYFFGDPADRQSAGRVERGARRTPGFAGESELARTA